MATTGDLISNDPTTTTTTTPRKRPFDSLLASLDASTFTPLAATSPPHDSSSPSPSFAPWDRASLSRRLATLRAYPNHRVASPINALWLARHGWCAIDRETMTCSRCHARVVLAQSAKMEAQKVLDDTYAQMVRLAHAPRCLWRNKESHRTLLKVAVLDATMAQRAYRERLTSLASLPHGVTIESDATTVDAQVAALSKSQTTALFGWTLEVHGDIQLLVCRDCHRRVRVMPDTPIHVVTEHHEYCPWINAQTQGSDAAWRILARHLEHKRSPTHVQESSLQDYREKMRHVRRRIGI